MTSLNRSYDRKTGGSLERKEAQGSVLNDDLEAGSGQGSGQGLNLIRESLF